MEFRDLRAQYGALKPQMDEAIQRVLDSGMYIGGSEVAALEQRLAEYVGVKHCITCGNGTDALQLALMAWNIGPGDAVIVPDFTFFSSGEVVSTMGATPIFVDVDRRTFNIDPAQIEPACKLAKSNGLIPKAVVTVDLFGLPADYPKITPLCEKLGLLILEDGAQGFGGSIEGQLACSFGDISTTSFFPAKPLGCYGDGGAIFTDDDDWASLIRSYAVHGRGSMKYDNVRIGMNSRLDALQAAILNTKFKSFIDREIDAVNESARQYSTLLSRTALELPCIPEGFTSSWAQYTVQLPAGMDRDELQAWLKGQGIPTMVYYPKPMHEQTAFRGASFDLSGCPLTTALTRTVLSLPMGPYLTSSDVKVVASTLIKAQSELR